MSNGNTWYASPGGNPGGAGTIADPMDLATAFNFNTLPASYGQMVTANPKVQPGDTLYLRGGNYDATWATDTSGLLTGWQCNLRGTANKRITVQAYPGPPIERATIRDLRFHNGGGLPFHQLEVRRYVDLELTATGTNPLPPPGTTGRTLAAGDMTARPSVGTYNAFGVGPNLGAVGNRLINCILHDVGGLDQFSDGVGGLDLVYGCLFYNNGWDLQNSLFAAGTDAYIENGTPNDGPSPPTQLVWQHNLSINEFALAVQVYSAGGALNNIQNIVLDGNILVSPGVMSLTPGISDGTQGHNTLPMIVLQGFDRSFRAKGIKISNNLTWRNRTEVSSGSRFGNAYYNCILGNDTGAVDFVDLEFTNNFLVGGAVLGFIDQWRSINFSKNTLIGNASYTVPQPQLLFWKRQPGTGQLPATFNGNRYILVGGASGTQPWAFSDAKTLQSWGAASVLIGSTTANYGVQFTAVAPGAGGNGITVAYSNTGPGPTTTVSVLGNAITVFPKVGETNDGVVAAIRASAAASMLVNVETIGSGSDLVVQVAATNLANGGAGWLSNAVGGAAIDTPPKWPVPGSTYTYPAEIAFKQRPADIFLFRNLFNEKRANLCIYNWGGAASASVDITAQMAQVVPPGAFYTIRRAEDYYGTRLASQSGTFTGAPVIVSMTAPNHPPAIPTGGTQAEADNANSAPEFAAFIITWVAP